MGAFDLSAFLLAAVVFVVLRGPTFDLPHASLTETLSAFGADLAKKKGVEWEAATFFLLVELCQSDSSVLHWPPLFSSDSSGLHRPSTSHLILVLFCLQQLFSWCFVGQHLICLTLHLPKLSQPLGLIWPRKRELSGKRRHIYIVWSNFVATSRTDRFPPKGSVLQGKSFYFR